MQIKDVTVVSIILLAVLSLGSVAPHGKARLLAHDGAELDAALAAGCKIVQSARTVKAVSCDSNAASSLGLQEDIQIFALDSGANTQIRASNVHAAGNTGAGRKIVVLDSGINYNHSELASSHLGGRDFVNNDSDPFDDNGHGTHVAGLITADGVDAKAKGAAPGAGIISGKVLDAAGNGYFSDMVAAIYWAVDGADGVANTSDDPGADAISMSIGTKAPYTYKGYCDSVMPDLTNAIKYARDRGVLVVVAAGNEGGSGVSIPGCVSYSTTVAAVDSKDKAPTWSSKGKAVDISAPGVSLYSTWLGTGYATASGTSMATPVVSATVALIKSAHPGYSPAQVENALFSTAKDLGKAGKDTTYGYGRVDALAASA
jgi:subtilisin family serine protease